MAHRLGVEIDRSACISSEDCVRLAPTAFALDNDNIAIVVDPSTVEEETLRAAERSCPSGAIRVFELGE